MSRDRRGNGIQEVVGSIPISSTKRINNLRRPRGRRCCFRHRFAHPRRSRGFRLCSAQTIATSRKAAAVPNTNVGIAHDRNKKASC